MATATTAAATTITPVEQTSAIRLDNPQFVQKIIDDYRSRIAHVFILYGNINDFSDNSGVRQGIIPTLAYAFDDNMKSEVGKMGVKSDRTASIVTKGKDQMVRIFATYNLSSGLHFPHETSKKQWVDAI